MMNLQEREVVVTEPQALSFDSSGGGTQQSIGPDRGGGQAVSSLIDPNDPNNRASAGPARILVSKEEIMG